MKKVTFFIQCLSSGGAEHQLSMLANFLDEEGYRVEIVTCVDKEDHYTINRNVCRIRIAMGSSKIIKMTSLAWFFLTHKSDCFISFGQRENLMSLIPLAIRRSVKVIVGERNYSESSPAYYEKFLFRWLYKRASYIVPNSFSQGRYITKLHPEYAKKTIVINNYTDPSFYKYSSLVRHTPLRFGIFCRYEIQKNCLRFLDAIANVKERSNFQFIIDWFGNQNFTNDILENYFEEVKKRVCIYNLQNYVFLNDAVKNVSERLQKYDAIILPSLHEGFSNAISEAICCGKPMLVSDVSDNSVMVHNGINGFLFDPTNTDSIAFAIEQFLQLSFEERSCMGQNSRKIAESLFDKRKFLSSYIKLIES